MTAPVLARRPKTSSERVRDHAARAATVSVRTLRLRLRRELEALEVRADHYLRRPLREPGLRVIVYFLSLRPLRLPGYERMLHDFLAKAVYSRSTNKGYLAWVSALAEIKAIWLLFSLGLEIQGIEQASPRGRPEKTCDVVAAYPGGPPIYFEVKLKATEDVQWIPDDVVEALAKFQYPATPQMVRHRNRPPAFDSAIDLPPILAAVGDQIARFERQKMLGLVAGRDVPPPLRRPGLDIELIFRSDQKLSRYKMHYVDPPWASDIERWLFDREAIGRDGTAMVPMVDAAVAKGADYLIAEGPSFSPPCEIALQCFDRAEEWSGRELLVKDPRLSNLCGILLFKGAEWLLMANADRPQPLLLKHVGGVTVPG